MWLVLIKELKELVRDRRTLFFMIALPILLFPLLFGLMGYFSYKAIEEEQSRVLKYSIVGAEHAADIAGALSAQPDVFEAVTLEAGMSYTDAIQQELVDFVLVVDEPLTDKVLQDGQGTLKIHLNDSGVSLIYDRVNEIVESRSETMQQGAFTELGLTEAQQTALLKPLVLEKVDVADKRESWGENIGGLIPYMVFLLCLQGAMMPAADLGAGEKERGTLETLLISPIERHNLVLGKFMTIAIAGITTALVTVSSMAIWGMVLSQGMALEMIGEFMSAISIIDFVLMFMMLVPIAAIFASILLSLSIYGRSFKEAQSYMGSLVIVVIIPTALALMPGVELKGVWSWVPLTNVALAIKELVKGTMDYFQLVAIFGSTAAIAGGLIAFCVYWFNKEKVLFR